MAQRRLNGLNKAQSSADLVPSLTAWLQSLRDANGGEQELLVEQAKNDPEKFMLDYVQPYKPILRKAFEQKYDAASFGTAEVASAAKVQISGLLTNGSQYFHLVCH
jgi:hypothetical protein